MKNIIFYPTHHSILRQTLNVDHRSRQPDHCELGNSGCADPGLGSGDSLVHLGAARDMPSFGPSPKCCRNLDVNCIWITKTGYQLQTCLNWHSAIPFSAEL